MAKRYNKTKCRTGSAFYKTKIILTFLAEIRSWTPAKTSTPVEVGSAVLAT